MPTFNSTEFLTVPQQVNKNKKDISSLDSRLTVAENAILGNTSVTMSDDITIVSLGVDVPLSVPGANDLKVVIDYNYTATDSHQLYGAKVIIPASIVNDSIVFPNANDVGYDVIFVAEATQLVNAITEEYTYVAQGSSPEFAFTINFSYRHDIGVYVINPTIRVTRQTDQQYMLIEEGEATALAPGVAWAYPDDVSEITNFSGTLYLYVKAAPANPYRLYAIARFGCSPLAVRGVALGATGVYLTRTEISGLHAGHGMSSIELWGHTSGENYYKLIVIDDRNRKLLLDDYASVTEAPVHFMDTALAVTYASQNNTQLATGSPASASNFADKRNVMYALTNAVSFVTPNITTMTIDGTNILPSAAVYSVRGSLTSVIVDIPIFTGFELVNGSGGAITITGRSVIVVNCSTSAAADRLGKISSAALYQSGTARIRNNNTNTGICVPVYVSRIGDVVTFTFCGEAALTLTINDTISFGILIKS